MVSVVMVLLRVIRSVMMVFLSSMEMGAQETARSSLAGIVWESASIISRLSADVIKKYQHDDLSKKYDVFFSFILIYKS